MSEREGPFKINATTKEKPRLLGGATSAVVVGYRLALRLIFRSLSAIFSMSMIALATRYWS